MARYGTKSRSTVKSAMHRMKRGKLKSGKGGKGGTVKSRKQAIAIGLSEAREKGAKVPARANRSRRHSAASGGSRRKSTSSRRSAHRSTSRSRSTSSRRS